MRKYCRVLVLMTLVLMTFIPGNLPAKASVETALPIKIMPFGDSITTSVGDSYNQFSPQASYRYWLYHSLIDTSINFKFIGTQTLNYGGAAKYSDFDPHHEGHSGYATYNFLNPADPNYIDKVLTPDNTPDMVLIHLGTCDFIYDLNYYVIDNVITNLGLLIDHFRAKNPEIIILLAQIIPCRGHDGCFNIDDMNAKIPALANQKTTLLSPVVVVDLYTGFNAYAGYDTYDGVHPNESGEKKMAAGWLKAIQLYWNYHLNKVYIPTIMTSP